MGLWVGLRLRVGMGWFLCDDGHGRDTRRPKCFDEYLLHRENNLTFFGNTAIVRSSKKDS